MDTDFKITKRSTPSPDLSNKMPQSMAQPESNLAYGLRRGLSTAASGLSVLASVPGTIASLGFGAANKLAPNHIPQYEELQKKWEHLPQTYPQIREAFNDWTGGYLAPRGEGEQKADDIVAELVSLGRGGNPKTYGDLLTRFAKAAGLVAAGESAKGGTKYLGLGELGQFIAKHGTQLLLGIMGTKQGVIQDMENKFNVGKQIGMGKDFNANKLSDTLSKVQDEIAESAGPARKWGLDRLMEIAPTISQKGSGLLDKNGNLNVFKQADVGKIMERIKDINAWFKDPSFPAGGSTIAKKISDPLREFVDEYSHSPNAPALFKEAWNDSREVYKALKNNWKITKDLNKYLTTDQLGSPIGKLIRNTLAFNWGIAPKTILAGGGALAIREGTKLLDFLSKSSIARNAYAEFLANMASGNVAAIKKNFGILSKEAKERGIISTPGFKITKRPEDNKIRLPKDMPFLT